MKIKKKVLIKDLIIPVGTIFTEIPSGSTKEFIGKGHIESTFGLTNDSYGSITYHSEDYEDELKEYFIDILEEI